MKEARGLGLALQMLVCFFVADAFEKAVILGATYGAGWPTGERAVLLDRYVPHLLSLAFDLLLALEIGRRTQAGRVWGMIYLAAMGILGLFLFVVEPERWLALSVGGRLLAILTQLVNLGFFALLAGRRSARVLVR